MTIPPSAPSAMLGLRTEERRRVASGGDDIWKSSGRSKRRRGTPERLNALRELRQIRRVE